MFHDPSKSELSGMGCWVLIFLLSRKSTRPIRGRQKQSAKIQQQQQHIRMSVSEEGDPTKDPRKQQQNLLCCCFANFEGIKKKLSYQDDIAI